MGLNLSVDFRLTDVIHSGIQLKLPQNIWYFDNATKIFFHAHDYYLEFSPAARPYETVFTS
jgi:hypothetical protein